MSKDHLGVAVVTGSSTGIGFETSLALARKGFITCATMRNVQKSKNLENISREENLPIKVFEMNVDSDNSVITAIKKIVNECGQINILVNNAGYGLFGALEDLTMSDFKKQFETNVFGIVRTIQAVLPYMRIQKNGIIINISSLAGLAGIPSQCAYSGTKFAVEGISEALSYELEPFGIKVILVEPGVIKTEFVQDLVVPANKYDIDKNENTMNYFADKKINDSPVSFYKDTIKKFLTFYYKSMSKAPHPVIVANEIVYAIESSLIDKDARAIQRIIIGKDSNKYSKLKKDLTDNEFHELLKTDLLK
jgi:NAD(P)-dependent dehydrogenase (short-subunit alcohol dehydrogenase family)